MKWHKKLFIAFITVLVFGLGFTASAKTILLVPQDDRPVSLSYVVDTAEKAGYTVITPPSYLLSGRDYQGDPERIWSWVQKNMQHADVAVFSTDTLIYGGLVDSRKHNESLEVLTKRETRIHTLHRTYPNVPIYAFGTIMRTPYASSSGVEPYYYTDYGTAIYRISGLQDKMDMGIITPAESAELLSLKLSVPSEYLQDWFKRRTKNTIINQRLIRSAKDGTFAYFCLGFDDSSPNSQSALEARYLKNTSKGISRKSYGSFPGADQLALLLIARYHVDSNHLKPTFSTLYPLGRAEDTIPTYESQPIGDTIAQHVTAVGGVMTHKKPDILLAINTPLSSTGESGQFSNFGMQKESTTNFINQVEEACMEEVPVAILDVYFANGSDNTLMKLLYEKGLLYSVASYNGWNTASNTIGYSIAQAVLAPEMSEQDHKEMLITQFLDNWAYQANIRKGLIRLQKTLGEDPSKPVSAAIREEMIAQIQRFAQKELHINPASVSAEFPWARLFEINLLISAKPEYPVFQTRAEKQRIAAEKAKAEKKNAEAMAARKPSTAPQPVPAESNTVRAPFSDTQAETSEPVESADAASSNKVPEM